MNWGLIPEVFYDVIGRLIPGFLLIVAAVTVALGPSEAAQVLLETAAAANLAVIILAAVASYTVAVVLKPFWDWLPMRKKEVHSAAERFLICRVRQELPEEAYKLVKLLAEMNLCEVMIVGLSVLLVVRASFPIADPGDLVEMRIVLAVVLLCIIAFYRWRRHLREEYDTDLENLGKLLKEKPEGATFE